VARTTKAERKHFMPFCLFFLWCLGANDAIDPFFTLSVEADRIQAQQGLRVAGIQVIGVNREGQATLQADKRGMAWLRNQKVPFVMLSQPRLAPFPAKALPATYFTPTTLLPWLQSLVDTHPDIAELLDIGDSYLKVQGMGGHDLWAVRVTDHLDQEEIEPEIRLIANIHGDEKSGLMVLCDFLEWLLTGYEAHDPQAVQLVEEAELWIVPMVNPDGNEQHRRYNGNWVDLNRNFGGPEGHSDGEAPFSEPETAAIASLSSTFGQRFVLGATYHSGEICFNTVWNYSYAVPADEAVFFSSRTGGTYCNPPGSCPTLSNHGLAAAYFDGCSQPGFWYTNGADWYRTWGDTNDWSYSVWGTVDTTLEVSENKTPDPSQIPIINGYHRQAAINYCLKAFQGIQGVVTSQENGLPLEARILVHEAPQPFFTDPLLGDFHKTLVPGTYSLTVEADGFHSATATDIVVSPDQLTYVDMALRPEGSQSTTAFVSLSFTEIEGNGNGEADPGEVLALNPLIEVVEGSGLAALEAELTSSNAELTLLAPLSGYPSGTPGQTLLPDQPFLIRLDPQAGCGTSLAFQLKVTQGTYQAEHAFSLITGHEVQETLTSYSNFHKREPSLGDLQSVHVPLTLEASPLVKAFLQRIHLTLEHGALSDLTIDLVSPSGTRRCLWNRNGGYARQMDRPFTTDVTGTTLAEGFGLEAVEGWSLELVDHQSQDNGRLQAVTLTFQAPGDYACSPLTFGHYLTKWGQPSYFDLNENGLVDVSDLIDYSIQIQP
jgi:subtilisin-like proprotein convertase family protein